MKTAFKEFIKPSLSTLNKIYGYTSIIKSFALTGVLSISLNACNTKSCENYNQTYSSIKTPIIRDTNSTIFVHNNIINENSKYFSNFTIYRLDDNKSTPDKIYSLKKEILKESGEIMIYQILFPQLPIKLFKDDMIGFINDNKLILLKNNQIAKEYNLKTINQSANEKIFLEQDDRNSETIKDFTFDAKFFYFNETLIDTETNKVHKLNLNNDQINKEQIIIEKIPNSDKFSLEVMNGDTYIADLNIDDINNVSLINYKKISSSEEVKDIVAEKDGKIIIKTSGKSKDGRYDTESFYLYNLENNEEKKLNFLAADYLSTYFDTNYFLYNDLSKILYRNASQDSQEIIEMNLNGENKKVILKSEDLPSGDKIQYTECSGSTL